METSLQLVEARDSSKEGSLVERTACFPDCRAEGRPSNKPGVHLWRGLLRHVSGLLRVAPIETASVWFLLLTPDKAPWQRDKSLELLSGSCAVTEGVCLILRSCESVGLRSLVFIYLSAFSPCNPSLVLKTFLVFKIFILGPDR